MVKDDEIIGKGYNHTFLDEHECLKERNFDEYHLGYNPGMCFAIHSEWDALIDAFENGHQVEGAKLYILGKYLDGTVRTNDHFSCTVCARLLMRAGVKKKVFLFEKITT